MEWLELILTKTWEEEGIWAFLFVALLIADAIAAVFLFKAQRRDRVEIIENDKENVVVLTEMKITTANMAENDRLILENGRMILEELRELRRARQ